MKTKIITLAFIAITSITCNLLAQNAASQSEDWDLTRDKDIKTRVIPTETGLSILFEHYVKVPVDNVGKPASGKKGYEYYQVSSEYSVSSFDNSVTEVKNPRDAASGLATGRRTYEPVRIQKKIDKSTPVILNRVSSPGTTAEVSTALGSDGSVGKAVFQELSITKGCASKTTVFSVVDGECVIPTGDCPDGDCDLKITWTWNDGGYSEIVEIGSSGNDGVRRNTANFILKIEDGVCTAMAINEKGLPGDKPRKTKSKN